MSNIIPFLPAILVFIVGLTTHRIKLAFVLGIVVSLIIAAEGNFASIWKILYLQMLSLVEYDKWNTWKNVIHTNNLFIIGFIFSIGALFELIKRANGIDLLIERTNHWITNKKRAETTSLLLSHGLFIDGCLSSLMVSTIMQPINNKFNIPKAKTALLADSMSGPLVVICPISCFTALAIALIGSSGISEVAKTNTHILGNPKLVYMQTIPYILYSFAIMAVIWLVVQKRISIGKMAGLENSVQEMPHKPEKKQPRKKIGLDQSISLISFPIFLFIFLFLLSDLKKGALNVLVDAPVSLILFLASFSSLLVSCFLFLKKKRFSPRSMCNYILISFKLSLGSSAIIFLAWTLAGILKTHLNLGVELAALLKGSGSIMFLPLFFFWLSATVSMALGTSWGTISIFIPLLPAVILSVMEIGEPTAASELPIFFPSLGAIISGAAFGDHVSLLSDSTILASTGSNCHPIQHVKTQWPYAVPVFIASSFGFLLAGYFAHFNSSLKYLIPLSVTIVLSLSIILYMHVQLKQKVRYQR